MSTTFDGQPVLRLENVIKDYGDKRAVNGLSFSVHRGELLCLLGANGAGKTTTIEMCEGFIAPTSGEISVLGFNPATHPDAVRERVGIMLQGGGGYTGIKVREMLQVAARYSANPHDPDWLIDILGLSGVAKNTYRRLSGGQQQRLALALAIIGRPDLVFLDEPFVGIDITSENIIIKLLKEMARQGRTILIVHHDLSKVNKYFDGLILLNKSLIAYGATSDVFTGEHIKRAFGSEILVSSEQGGADNDSAIRE